MDKEDKENLRIAKLFLLDIKDQQKEIVSEIKGLGNYLGIIIIILFIGLFPQIKDAFIWNYNYFTAINKD